MPKTVQTHQSAEMNEERQTLDDQALTDLTLDERDATDVTGGAGKSCATGRHFNDGHMTF
jgi:hypothetical protein